jgi:predicted RNA-binding protein YlxR (DUF448 family)
VRRRPAVKMKGRVVRIVPMATQGVSAWRQAQLLTGRSAWVAANA